MSCKKQQFDLKTAKTVLNERKNKGKQWSREKRYYYCNKCGFYHLTSEEEWIEPKEIKLEDLKYAEKWKTLLGY